MQRPPLGERCRVEWWMGSFAWSRRSRGASRSFPTRGRRQVTVWSNREERKYSSQVPEPVKNQLSAYHGGVPMRDPLTLVAVGDLQLGDSPTSVGYGFYSRYAGASLESLLGGVRPALSNADVVFGNLETTLVPPTRGERR